MRFSRGLVANVGLALTAVLGTLGIVEGTLRLTWKAERVTIRHDDLLGFGGRPHAETLWTREMAGRPRTVRLNAGGFHDHERAPTPSPGTRRLVLVGDSFLEAYQVDIDSSYAQRLARRLSTAARPVEAVNLGVHGYGLGTYVLQVEQRLPAWQADGVVLSLFLGNDLHDNFTPVASPAVPRFHLDGADLAYLPVPPAGPRVWLRDHVLARSVLVRFLWMRVIKTNRGAMDLARQAGMVSTPDLEGDAGGRTEEIVEVGQRLLRRLHAALGRQQTPWFVLVLPDPFRVHDLVRLRTDGAPAPDEERAAIDAGVLAELRRLGVPHLYPLERFVEAGRRDDGVYRNGFGHLTDEAHGVVADLLAAPIEDLLAEAGG
jgi:lysophospholipase L1-like esterase